jgi:hypothetical protein
MLFDTRWEYRGQFNQIQHCVESWVSVFHLALEQL